MQPGWFPGHKSALIYINIGLGTQPYAMDIPLVPVFQMIGPNNDPFPGTFCLQNITVPQNIGARIGDNATIQVILTAQHGAPLYNVSHPIFPVWESMLIWCYSVQISSGQNRKMLQWQHRIYVLTQLKLDSASWVQYPSLQAINERLLWGSGPREQLRHIAARKGNLQWFLSSCRSHASATQHCLAGQAIQAPRALLWNRTSKSTPDPLIRVWAVLACDWWYTYLPHLPAVVSEQYRTGLLKAFPREAFSVMARHEDGEVGRFAVPCCRHHKSE
jgi:hypothetical protein